MTQRTWFITGVNSGFGRVMTEQLLARGDRVAGTIRKMDAMDDLKEKYGDLLWLDHLDMTDTAGIQRVVTNAKALAAGLLRRGLLLTTGGTDNHLMVIDLRPTGLRGRAVQAAFDEVGVTVNANTFPGHGGTPFNPNGIRLGTPSVTSRGMGEAEMDEIAALVHGMLTGFDEAEVRAEVRERSRALCRRFPLPYRDTVPA